MAAEVETRSDPAGVLEDAGRFLELDPVRHNVILTLLHARASHPEPGRYWIVRVDGGVTGVVFQSPLSFVATVTPMLPDAAIAAVEAIVDQGVLLPGVTGEAATAARFAGHWAERTRSPARPVQGQRIYEVERAIAARPVTGQLRPAVDDDRELLVEWERAYQAEAGDAPSDAVEVVERRLGAGHLWVWDDGAPVAMAGLSLAVAGVVRIGPVYTAGEHRRRGYASALVAALSRGTLAEGLRCILYTDLANPTSNAIYRAIGYRAVAEVLRYRFDGAAPGLAAWRR